MTENTTTIPFNDWFLRLNLHFIDHAQLMEFSRVKIQKKKWLEPVLISYLERSFPFLHIALENKERKTKFQSSFSLLFLCMITFGFRFDFD